jgi:hypothetical protein
MFFHEVNRAANQFFDTPNGRVQTTLWKLKILWIIQLPNNFLIDENYLVLSGKKRRLSSTSTI